MWTITGSFDGAVPGEHGHQKTKLLKNGQKYLLSRKDADLVVNDKKISREHLYIIVGGYTAEDVANPDAVPTLEVRNVKAKSLGIDRDEIQFSVNSGATERLQDGDQILLLHNVVLTVRWQKLCCFESPGRGRTPISIDGCQSLGINVVRTHNPGITHHLTPNFTLSPALATSLLLAAQFVKPDWLQEILRLGTLPKNDPKSLEYTFALPPETKYRPVFAPSLAPSFKTFKTWEPNEERLHMFRKCKFIFVGEKGREVNNDYQTMIACGDGECDTFTVDAGLHKWKKILSKGMAWAQDKGGKLHLVADSEAMEIAVGREAWQELVDEAKGLGLQFIMPQNIVQAIAHVDPFWMDSAAPTVGHHEEESAPPDVVPNTYPDEPSIPPQLGQSAPTEQRRVTRASSRAPSEAPEAEKPEPPPVPVFRSIVSRRAKRKPLSLLDPDDSVLAEDESISVPGASTPVAQEPIPEPVAPAFTQAPRSSRFRRRAGTNTRALDLLDFGESNNDPSTLNKYKSLFDESDPDRVAQGGPSGINGQSMAQSITQSETQTQSRTQPGLNSAAVQLLDAVIEEEEETPMGATSSTTLRAKRKADELNDVEMQEAPDNSGAGVSAATQSQQRGQKRRAVEDVNAVEPSAQATDPSQLSDKSSSSKSVKPPSKSQKKGAPTEKPDTDEQFLKAVNSTKRSKKREDEFDREFNKLRISRPELDRDQEAKEWALLADFGNEGVRGNFMVLMEMDVYTSAKPHRTARIRGKPEWDGKPDFKKFKKKSADRRRQAVELVVSEENDHGIGTAYWKATQSQSQVPSQEAIIGSAKATKTQPQPQKSGRGKSRALAIAVDSDDSDEAQPTLKSRRGKSAASKSQPAPSTRRTRSREPTQPLFLASDDDDVPARTRSLEDIGEDDGGILSINGIGIEDDEDGTSATMLSNGAGESSQEVAPRSRRTAQKRKAPAPIADDDSDDATFKGFGSRKKRGRFT